MARLVLVVKAFPLAVQPVPADRATRGAVEVLMLVLVAMAFPLAARPGLADQATGRAVEVVALEK